MCDYDIAKIGLDVRRKSPKATIGNESRFPKECSLNTYISKLPDQFVKNHSKTNTKAITLGTFSNEKRWNNQGVKSPGVGDYDITRFKSYAKVSETNF